jgi:hypothetical protein
VETHIEPIGELGFRCVGRNPDTGVHTFAIDSQPVRFPPTGLAHNIDEKLTVYVEAKGRH